VLGDKAFGLAEYLSDLSIRSVTEWLNWPQPLLETWSWTEQIKASLKTSGTRWECRRPESEPPTMCLPSCPGGATASSKSSVRNHPIGRF
jgi:hypothetical protein